MKLPCSIDLLVDVLLGLDIDGREGRLVVMVSQSACRLLRLSKRGQRAILEGSRVSCVSLFHQIGIASLMKGTAGCTLAGSFASLAEMDVSSSLQVWSRSERVILSEKHLGDPQWM